MKARHTSGLLRGLATLAACVALAAPLALGTGCRKPAPRPGTAAPEKPVDLAVTMKGDVVAMGTTYTPTGGRVTLEPGSLVYVGRSPNLRKFYMKKGSATPPPEIFLSTGKAFYDTWVPTSH